MKLFRKSKIERIFNKLDKKFYRRYKISYYLNSSIYKLTWQPYLGLKDKEGNEIMIILTKNLDSGLEKELNDLQWKILKWQEEQEKK